MKKPIQRRAFSSDIKVRQNDDGTVGLRGYFAIFDSPAHGEVIERTAFTRTLANQDDIRLLTNHDGVPMARTKSGTLELGVDERGGWWDAPNLDPSNPDVARLLSATERGDIDQCSFAGYWHDAPVVDKLTRVREVGLVDVSVVTYPWYEDTSVTMTGNRNQGMAALALRNLPPTSRDEIESILRAAPPGLQSYGDQQAALCEAISSMVVEATGVEYCWCWIDDMGSDWAVYSVSGGDAYMQIPYSIDEAGAVSLGTPFEVNRVTEYQPVVESDQEDRSTDEEVQTDSLPPEVPARGLAATEARNLLANALGM